MNTKSSKKYLSVTTIVTMLLMTSVSYAEEFEATLRWSQRVEMSAPVNGVVQDVFAVAGKIVAKGETLIQLDPRGFVADLNFAKAAVKNADEQNQEFKRELDRQTDMYDRTMLSEHDLQVAKNNYTGSTAKLSQAKAKLTKAKLNLEYSAVRAPFNAIVIKTTATKGQVVAVALNPPVLVVLAEANRMIARFYSGQALLSKMTAGQGVQVMVDGARYQGKIQNIALEPEKLTQYAVDVIFDSSKNILRAGQKAKIEL
ncbi:MAG: efflux RND transporter periplasmic adaptor subunit [Gammaproteobacteria bacterium]|nr:efflux RND transporter periplasmic adaptor subunit [Gammaproteobacteria bacterium]